MDRRWMGTKMLERTPGQLHTYNINKEGSKLTNRFKGIQPSTVEAAESVSEVLRYYAELIEDNPITINSRNAAAMFTRIGRAETVARLGDWWFEEPQQQVHPSSSRLAVREATRCVQIMQRIASVIQKQVFRCTSEEMANALWGISFLGPRVMDIPLTNELNMDALIHDLVNRLLRDISKLRPVDMTLLVESLARLRYKNIDYLMKAVTYETKMKIARFHDLDLPRFLWGLAQLGYPSRDGTDREGLLSTLAWECKRRLERWNAIELAQVVWAFGVLKFNSIQHLLTLINKQRVESGQPKADAVVKLLWGFDALNHHPGKMGLIKLGRCFAMDLHNLFPRDVATGCLSLLNFGLVDDRVPTRIKELILRSEVDDWSAREAANMLWFLARADFLEQDAFMVLRRFMLECKPDELPHHCQVDLYRCFLHMNIFRPSMARLLPASIGEKCQKAWIEEQSKLPRSPITRSVLETLQLMGYTVNESASIHNGILFAHTATNKSDGSFAVEIIHPPKCFINDESALSHQQSWREDLLVSWKWKIIRVEEKRWGRMKDERDKADYLSMLSKRA